MDEENIIEEYTFHLKPDSKKITQNVLNVEDMGHRETELFHHLPRIND